MTIEVIYSHTVRWNRFLKFPCVYRMLREIPGLFKHWGCHYFSWSSSHYKCRPGNQTARCSASMIWTTKRWPTDDNGHTNCSGNSRIWWRRRRGRPSSGGWWNSERRRMSWRGPRKSEWRAREREREFNYTNALISVLFKINKVFFFLSGLILTQMDLLNRLSVARIGKCPMSLNE